eukprot:tig00000342_g24218.t1
MNDVPPAAAAVKPYMMRAAELDAADPLVAYFCRLYSVQQAMALPAFQGDQVVRKWVVALLDRLERDKQQLDPTRVAQGREHMEGFALQVFKAADDEDRSGAATLATARSYYAASNFFEVCSQFGPVDPQLVTMQKYAKFKSVEITRAIKAGQVPRAGPPAGEDLPSPPDEAPAPPREQPPAPQLQSRSSFRAPDTASGPPPAGPGTGAAISPAPSRGPHGDAPPSYSYGPAPPSQPWGASGPAPPSRLGAPTAAPSPAASGHLNSQSASGLAGPAGPADVARMAEAQRYAKYAVSALQFSDAQEAVKNLRAALSILTGDP